MLFQKELKQDFENNNQQKSSRENALLKEISAVKSALEKALEELGLYKSFKEGLEKDKSALEAQVNFKAVSKE